MFCAAILPGWLVAQQPIDPQAQPFRVETDVIRMDVSVLDKERRPIRGLKAEDFTVLENGKPQRIVAVSEIETADIDPPLPAQMRFAVPDVAGNDLSDQTTDGRLFAVLIDDRNLPSYETEITMNARAVARDVIDRLGPSDAAAVLYAVDAGRSQDFTTDRQKLFAAVDAYQPRGHDPVVEPSSGVIGAAPPVRGDIQQAAPVNADSYCGRLQPAIPKLSTLVARMSMSPQRKRKTVIYIGMGVPMSWDPRARCSSLASMMQEAFRQAQHANIVVHLVSPVGIAGFNAPYERLVRNPMTPGPSADPRDSPINRDFMQIVAENTGGEAAYTPEKLDAAIATVFDESAAYYLIGYQTSNGRPDGKFRKVEVKVRKPGANVRTRSGYWTPDPEGRVKGADQPATSNDLGLANMMSPAGLPLRSSVVPIGRARAGSSAEVEMAVVLTPRMPPLRIQTADTLTIIRNIYDADGKVSAPVREIVPVTLQPAAGDDVLVDVLSGLPLTLAPGRYEGRFNVTSKLTGMSATVYTPFEVPDFARAPISMSGIVLGTLDATSASVEPRRALLPIVPTNSREFAPSDKIAVFLRLFQGGAGTTVGAVLNVRLLNVQDSVVDDQTKTFAAESFADNQSADYHADLPLAQLSRGPYLLSATATLPDGKNVRRDVLFRVK